MAARHLPEHDEWGPDGRCEVLIWEEDGSLTRCGHPRWPASFDASQAPLPQKQRTAEQGTRNAVVGVVVGLVGLAIFVDWLAFIVVVLNGDEHPELAASFIVRVAATVGYGAAVVWLWTRR